MISTETRPPDQRTNTIKVALHIMEKSKCEPIERITNALLCLYPEDIQSIETALKQVLTTLNQKI